MEDWVPGGVTVCHLLVRVLPEPSECWGVEQEDVEGRAPAGASEWSSSAKVPPLCGHRGEEMSVSRLRGP